MSVQLLPRLAPIGVAGVFESFGAGGMTPSRSRQLLEEYAAAVSFAASGGHRSEELSGLIGTRLREIATSTGFPENPSQVARAKFDHEASIFLATMPELATGESLRDDVWAFIATIVAPDVAAWRFPDRAAHRFEGGVRNAFQRLWVRGSVLDRGEGVDDRWSLIRMLSEDASVQIFERSSIAGSRPLAMALAEGWVRMAARLGRAAMEPVMRRATKVLRVRNEVFDIASLPQDERDALVSECFDQAWIAEQEDFAVLVKTEVFPGGKRRPRNETGGATE